MRQCAKFLTALGVAVLAPAGPALSSASSPALSLAGIALQLRELPRHFFVMVPRYQANAVSAHQDHVSVASLEKQGRS